MGLFCSLMPHFHLGCVLLLVVFLADDSVFLLNLFTQSVGYYFQYIVQVGFHTDAFAMRDDAPDGKESPNWMNSWTLFYCKDSQLCLF